MIGYAYDFPMIGYAYANIYETTFSKNFLRHSARLYLKIKQ